MGNDPKTTKAATKTAKKPKAIGGHSKASCAARAAGLSPKLEAFAQHLALHDNQTEAYEAVYKPKGKSRPNIGANASRLVDRYPEVLERVLELRREMARVAKEQFGLDAAWVLRRLHEEAVADIAAIYGDDGKLRPVNEWPEVFRTGLVNGIDTEIRTDANGGSAISTKLRFSDRIKRIEMIGRHVDVQAFLDRKDSGKKDATTTPVSATLEFIAAIVGVRADRPSPEPVQDGPVLPGAVCAEPALAGASVAVRALPRSAVGAERVPGPLGERAQ
jgi:phage terminase small subunit